jgi:hypothetical protein
MQGALVSMLMILTGLSSYSEKNDDDDLPPAVSATAVQGSAEPAAPVVYPQYVAVPYNAGYAPSHSIGRVVHQTIVSFFHGHDDDVMTAKEIESAFYSGAYSGLNDYPPSAVLSSDAPR